MKKNVALLPVLALLAVLPVHAQENNAPVQDHSEHMGMNMEGSSGSSSGAQSQSNDPYAQSRIDMHKGMDVKTTGNPDLDFVNNMIPHHEGALSMARIQLENGRDADLKRLARNIIREQEKEIALMKRVRERLMAKPKVVDPQK